MLKYMKYLVPIFIIAFSFSSFTLEIEDIGEEYIAAYKNFYPSKALNLGIQNAIYDYENFSPENITQWISFNKMVLDIISKPDSPYVIQNKIDARLLRLQIKEEIDKWENRKVHQNLLSTYTSLISEALDPIFENNFLTNSEKSALICNRLESVQKLCANAQNSLENGQKNDLERGLKSLKRASNYYSSEISENIQKLPKLSSCNNLEIKCDETALSIDMLINYLESNLLPNAKESPLSIGQNEYAKQLAYYTDSELTPYQLEKMALAEIETVKNLMEEVSINYLKNQYPNKSLPFTRDETIKAALVDMEKDVPINAKDCLDFWNELKESAIAFVEKHDIVTLPEFQTLQIIAAPESAGPAARIGWVQSARPFDPNPVTTLFLPSIPETFPEQEQIDFWASFNKPFTRMIVIHELIPGHYMQMKIIRETPHHVRLFFPFALYSEGYATFTERVLLDAGWEKDNPLTFLAHLRKRLENANRAYTSMQLHCNNWTPEQVMEFSTETSLVAPQFAKSLWGRISANPMQVISYFLGGKQFSDLFDSEKEKQGDKFVLKDFMDTILRMGPIPIDEFPSIFEINSMN